MAWRIGHNKTNKSKDTSYFLFYFLNASHGGMVVGHGVLLNMGVAHMHTVWSAHTGMGIWIAWVYRVGFIHGINSDDGV
jgi:hypothetical protein